MAGFDDARKKGLDIAAIGNHDHLGTRYHRVPDLHFGYFQGALHHCQRIGVEDTLVAGLAQQFLQFLAVPRQVRKCLADFLDPGSFSRAVTRLVFTHHANPLLFQ